MHEPSISVAANNGRPATAEANGMTKFHRGNLLRLKHDLLAAVATTEEVCRALLDEVCDGPEVFLADLRDMLEGCRPLVEFVKRELPDPQSPSRSISADELRRLRHDLKNLLNHVHSGCQFAQTFDTKELQGKYHADLCIVRECCERFLERLEDLRGKQETSEVANPLFMQEATFQTSVTPGHVLVVDDEPTSRENIARLLQQAGHTVLQAANGREALKHLDQRDDIDVVLLDVRMAEMDGYQTLQAMKGDSDWQKIPVVMISAVDDMLGAARCIDLGADDYLTKPIDFRLLAARVKASLAQSHLKRQEKRWLRNIKHQKKRADELLYRLFPHVIVQQLLANESVIPTRYDHVAVMFCDLVSFTSYCDARDPRVVIDELQNLFEDFERIASAQHVEKIKTIGDCFMASSGLTELRANAVLDCVRAGRDIIAAAQRRGKWKVRIGIHAGPVVAGLVGKRQFCFDIWGATVNTASRIESEGTPGTMTLSRDAWEQVEDYCRGEFLGQKLLKGVEAPLGLYRFREFRKVDL